MSLLYTAQRCILLRVLALARIRIFSDTASIRRRVWFRILRSDCGEPVILSEQWWAFGMTPARVLVSCRYPLHSVFPAILVAHFYCILSASITFATASTPVATPATISYATHMLPPTESAPYTLCIFLVTRDLDTVPRQRLCLPEANIGSHRLCSWLCPSEANVK
jgi:hypothetical protein